MKNIDVSRQYFLFGLICFFQLLVLIYCGLSRSTYYFDEFFTFNLANSYLLPFTLIGNDNFTLPFFNHWMSGSFIDSIFSVSKNHTFAYGSVWYNQSMDVHPPLYYAIVHTLSSLIPEKMSIWMALIPNIFFFLITQFYLLKLSRKFLDGYYIQLLPCLVYGMSYGGINNTIYMRMYALLTMLVVINYYMHYVLWEKVDENKLEDSYFFDFMAIFIVNI